jgi:hypothetical protein
VRLLRMIAAQLEQGLDSPTWAQDKLAELQLFRRRVAQAMAVATAEATAMAADTVANAYRLGMAVGEGELLAAGLSAGAPTQAERAVEALTRAHAGQLEAASPMVVRQTADAYRDAVVRASSGTLSGAATRVQDAQQALDTLARGGITAFTDTAGRQWGLESYVDMATRTTTAQAAVVGAMDRMEQGGLHLFIVSDSPRECELCAEWEGKVLARGPVPAMQTNALTGILEPVTVDGTVDEAIAAGLFHPNCTHNLSGYVHGVTKRSMAHHNPEGYAEKVEQRRLERGLRDWKRREAAAITPEAKRAAAGKVRGWQARLAEHTARTGLPRKYGRESFDVKSISVPGDRLAGREALDALDADVLEAEVAELMRLNDYGPRFERLAEELDRRDNVVQTLAAEADAIAEREALERLLYGNHQLSEGIVRREVKRDLEAELRDEYNSWVHTQWLRAEAECRGVLLNKRAQAAGIDPVDLFTRRLRDLSKYASQELQEWFAQPGNQRLSFPEFRAGRMDDKKAREASQRLRNRGWESEFG